MTVTIQNQADTQGARRVADVGPLPSDPASNASYTLTYTDGKLTSVDCVRHGVTYTRELTWDGAYLSTVSQWNGGVDAVVRSTAAPAGPGAGMIWIKDGGAGVADIVSIYVKWSDDTYDWLQIGAAL